MAAACIAASSATMEAGGIGSRTVHQMSAEAAAFKPGSPMHHLGLTLAKAANDVAADLVALLPSLARSRPRPKRALHLELLLAPTDASTVNYGLSPPPRFLVEVP